MSLLNLHLGDNAEVNDGDFANTTYVGLSVALPLRMLNPSKRNQLVIYTSAIETLADWQAHVVTLDFFFLGYLRDRPASNDRNVEAPRRSINEESGHVEGVALCGGAGLVPEISEKEEIKRYHMGLPVGQGLDRRRIDDKLVPLAGIQHAQRQGNAQANIGCVGEIAVVDLRIVP